MSDRQILDEVLTLIVAGHKTTASALQWFWYLIARNAAAADTLHREAVAGTPSAGDPDAYPLTRAAIAETLRLYPPGWLLTRRAIADDRIGDVAVAAGDDVLIPPYLVHRHPAFWPDPERFAPERFRDPGQAQRSRFSYLPFGLGPRMHRRAPGADGNAGTRGGRVARTGLCPCERRAHPSSREGQPASGRAHRDACHATRSRVNVAATLQAVLEKAAHSQAAVHYIGSDGQEARLPYADLRSRALGMLGYLQRRGVHPGDELVLMVDELAPFVDAFWACVLGRIAAVPMAAGTSDEQRLKAVRVLERLARPHLLVDRKALARLSAFADANGFSAASALLARRAICLDDITDLDRPGTLVPASADDVAFVQFSSGSTGTPKGVVLAQPADDHRCDQRRHRGRERAGFVAVMDAADARHGPDRVPPRPREGLCIALADQLSAQFVRRPLSWLQKAAEHGVSVTCSPNFGYKHLLKSFDPDQCAGLDLSCLRVVINGAEPISAALCREFLAAFGPFGLRHDVMLPVYGLAEASLAVTFPPLRRELLRR